MKTTSCVTVNLAAFLVSLLSLPLSAQPFTDGIIRVGGIVRPVALSVDDLKKFAVAKLKTKDRDGREHLFEGTLLSTLLDSVGAPLGSQLKGKNLAGYVVIKAADGYQVIFSLAEIDPEFNGNPVLLAISSDDRPLSPDDGPFRIVAPGDKKRARWVRQVTAIEVKFSDE